jgi:xylan 1,4-beta-xylosidase
MRRLLAVCTTGAVMCMTSAEMMSQTSAGPIEIKVNLANTVGSYEPIYRWFGYDEANYTTTPNGTKLLSELHDMSPVPV